MKEPGKSEMEVVDASNKQPLSRSQEPRRANPMNRRETEHFKAVLERRHSTGHTIPDQASIYTTGEIVMVKREPFRITGVSKQGLVLRGVRGDDAYQPRAEAMTLLDAAQLIGGTLVVFYREEEPDPTQIDRWEPGQQLTVAGREYIVTGKALIVVPIAASEPIQPKSKAPTWMQDEPSSPSPTSPDPEDHGSSPPPSAS